MQSHTLIAAAGACVSVLTVSAGLALAQPQVATPTGFSIQSWNAGTNVPENTWRPEAQAISWGDGLRWDWWERNEANQIVRPVCTPIFDGRVPGITGAYQFPAARAANILPDGTMNRGTSWEFQAQGNESATLEIWFKPADLTGSHVLWEIGANNRGIAFALDGADLVFSADSTSGDPAVTYSYIHRHTLANTEWVQAVMVINYATFVIESWVNGVFVDSESIPLPPTTWRWTSSNPAGLGQLGTDPLFPNSGIAANAIPPANLTNYDGQIAIMRFYDVDLFPDEILDNYNAITDENAALRRADFNGDGMVTTADVLDGLAWFAQSTTAPTGAVEFPFPSSPGGGVQSNDPADDETILGDFIANRDRGFNATSQEASFAFPIGGMNVLEPVNMYDPAFPSIRTAWVMNGLEAFRGPRLEFTDDNFNSCRVQFWMYVEDITGNHVLFEAGGATGGFSMVALGSQLAGAINTLATDGLDQASIFSAPGVLTTGWHQFEIVVRRFAVNGTSIESPGLGQGYELYMDGVQVAAINDQPGPDGIIGMGADDVNVFTPAASSGNAHYINGDRAGWGVIESTAYLPTGVDPLTLTPFNGMAGPIRVSQGQPLPADIATQFAAESTQTVINARNDVNADGAANFLDVLANLTMYDAAK